MRPAVATFTLRLAPGLRAGLGALVCLGAVAAESRAALQWDTLETVIRVRATDTTAQTRFAFVNAGSTPVTITGVEPGCGCTVPALAKNKFAPGERGELALEFHPRNREGLNRIPIVVATDDGATVALQFVADVEAVVSFDNRFVFWKGDEPRTPKRMRLTFAESAGGRIEKVTTSDPQFAVAFRPVGTTGRDYEIEVTPPAVVINYAVITVHARLGPEGAAREFSLVARTMPAPAGGPAPAKP